MASSLPPLVPVPFAEAIAWARARGVVLPDIYYGQLQGVARAKAFSVAGITKLDQLLLVHESVTDALSTGQTFAEWKKIVLAQDSGLGAMPMHRLDNIFRTNIQSDYARGRCEQQGRNKERFPWLLYDAVNDSRTRPAHAAMDGFIARHDDPIWSKWRPPCGYRCRCRLISLTEKQAQKYIDADARRLGNDKPQDHLWGLTYAQARSRAISEGPDDGWDYDVCQECGGSQLDHCSGATRGIEQATDDRIRTLHEVAGTPGGQALSDAAIPELTAARDAAVNAASAPPLSPPLRFFGDGVNFTGEDLAAALRGIAPERAEALLTFLDRSNVSTIFATKSTIVKGGTDALASKVSKALPHARWYKEDFYRGKDCAGFTGPKLDHVVIKIKRKDLAVDPEKVKKAVEGIIGRSTKVSQNNLPFSFSSAPSLTESESQFVTWLHEIGHQVSCKLGRNGRLAGAPAFTAYSKTTQLEWIAETFVAHLVSPSTVQTLYPEIAGYFDRLWDSLYDRIK